MAKKIKKFLLPVLIILIISLPVFILQLRVNNNIKALEKSGKLDSAYAALGYIDTIHSQDFSLKDKELKNTLISTNWSGFHYELFLAEILEEYKISNDTLIKYHYGRNRLRSGSHTPISEYIKYKILFINDNKIALRNIEEPTFKDQVFKYKFLSVNGNISLMFYTENDSLIGSENYIGQKYIMLFPDNKVHTTNIAEDFSKTHLMNYSIGDTLVNFNNLVINDDISFLTLIRGHSILDYYGILDYKVYIEKGDFGICGLETIKNIITKIEFVFSDKNTADYFIDFLNKKFETNYPKNESVYYWNNNNVVMRKFEPKNDYNFYIPNDIIRKKNEPKYHLIVYDRPVLYYLYSTMFKEYFASFISRFEKEKEDKNKRKELLIN